MHAPRILIALVATAGLALGLMACGSSDGGVARPTDPVLAQGQDVYTANCSTCHGGKGGGGQGVKLAGVVEEHLTFDEHIATITDGKGNGMPAFGTKLSPEEINAVARYEREVL